MRAISIKSLVLAASVAVIGLAGAALPTTARAQAIISVQIGTPPPPPRYEVVPAARPGYVWAAGHYEWRHGNYIWRRGHWVQARPGHVYVPAAWRAQGSRWLYQPPRWDARPLPASSRSRHWRDDDSYRGGRHDNRPRYRTDRDRDGVPDRTDRYPRNPRRH